MNRDPAVSLLTALKRRCSDARGFALIEAVAASAVFALIVLGVLAGIDGAAGSSGREKARSIAGVLAEQDQERMRGMRAIDLSSYTESRDLNVAGAKYTISSESTWIRDNTGGTISCTNDTKQADYLRIRSTVTSESVGKRTAPVTIDSLVAPPVGALGSNQGTLAVQVNNRDGNGAQSRLVTITSGAFTKSALTNQVGCAVFAYIPVGAYDVALDEPGWVDPNGVQNVHASGNVTNGTTNVVKLDYDVAGTVNATFDTRYYDAQADNFVVGPSRAYAFSLANAGVPSTGYRLFTPVLSPANAITATKLFPFKAAYGLYAGTCLAHNPTVANGGQVQLVDRAGIYDVTVRQPALRVRVTRSGDPVLKANVTATYDGSGACADDKIAGIRTDPINGLTSFGGTDARRGYVTRVPIVGFPFDPGIPYGRWFICADDGAYLGWSGNSSPRRRTVTVDNVTVNGTATTTTINLSGGASSSGTCPS